MNKKIKTLLLTAAACMLITTNVLAQEKSVNYDPPVVEVESGALQGFVDEDTYCFRGIPYATAERFEQPQEVEPWEGVKNAQAYGATCPIEHPTSVSGNAFVWPRRYWVENEDCMNLNIWTPSIDSEAKKPVMVFFHGGGFTNGSSIEGIDYDGKNLSEFGDVVVVTVNHRLNILGCLDLSAYGEEYKNSANITLADLVASLKWVNKNIEAFGGDPERVMIFGQSGGSWKTASMYYIQEASGLFANGVGMSNGGTASMAPGESAEVAALVLEKLGLNENEVEKLKEVPYEELTAAGTEALAELSEEKGKAVSWAPTMDGEFYQEEMTDYAKEAPYICGSVFSEFVGTQHKGIRKNEWTEDEVDAKLTEAYGEDKDAVVNEFTALFPDKKIQDVMFYNDRHNDPLLGAVSAVKAAAESSNAPVYHYLFSYEAQVNGGITAFHGGELHFVFHNIGMPDIALATGGTEECYKLQDEVAQALVNFATTGNPSQEGLEWKPWTEEGNETMMFDVNSQCVSFDDAALCDLLAAHN